LLSQLDKALADLLSSRSDSSAAVGGPGVPAEYNRGSVADIGINDQRHGRDELAAFKGDADGTLASEAAGGGVDGDDDVVIELTSGDVRLPIADDIQPRWEVLYQYAQNEISREGEVGDEERSDVTHSRIEALLSQRHAVDRLAHEVALQGMKRLAAQQAQESNREAFERAYNARMALAQSIREHAHSNIDWDPVQGFTFDISCVVGLAPDVTHARARMSLHDGADLVSPIYTTDVAEAFYSGGMGGRTARLGLAGKEKRSFTHVIPSQALVLLVELEVTKQDHGEGARVM